MIDPKNPDYSFSPVAAERPSFGYLPECFTGKPSISLVTPLIETGTAITETAHALLKQSFQRWEWVLVGNVSNPGEPLRGIRSLSSSDPRVKTVDRKRILSVAEAFNVGFQNASGRYLVPLMPGFLLEPTALEKWLWVLEIFPGISFVDGYVVETGEHNGLRPTGFHLKEKFFEAGPWNMPCMVRRKVYDMVGGFEEDCPEVSAARNFWFECAEKGHWGVTVPEYLSWIVRGKSILWEGEGKVTRIIGTSLSDSEKNSSVGRMGIPPRVPKCSSFIDLAGCGSLTHRSLRKEKPRMLIIVPWLTVGGADKFNLDLIRQLVRAGWEVTVATTLKSDHPWLPHFCRHTPDVFALDHFLPVKAYPAFLRYLIASRGIDTVMVSNSELGYLLLPYLRSSFPQVSFVDYCHSEDPLSQHGGYPGLSVVYREYLDMSVVASHHLKRWIVEHGGDEDKTEVCYVNVDPDNWIPDPAFRQRIRKLAGIDDQTPLILYVGRLCQYKQPRIFAQVMKGLADRGCRFMSWVIGDGEDRAWLEDYLTKEGLVDLVWMIGSLPPHQVRQVMLAGDILFLPSLWEGIALTIYEAMAAGLAVVGADVGGQKELVTDDCGFLLPVGSEKEQTENYVNILSRLITNPQMRSRMGKNSRERICRHFHIDFMGTRMVELIQKASRRHALSPVLDSACADLGDIAPQAFSYLHLYGRMERLWFEDDLPGAFSRFSKYYSQLKKILAPLYGLALSKGLRWLVPLKDVLKQKFRVE